MVTIPKQTNPYRDRLQDTLLEYFKLCNLPGDLRLMFDIYIDGFANYEISDTQGRIFHPDCRPPRIRKSRKISEEELNNIYDSIANELERSSASIHANIAKGHRINFSIDDVVYLVQQGMVSSFETGTTLADNYRPSLERYVKISGGFESGKKR